MDTITEVRCQNNRVFITVSDGSLIQFGLDEESILKVESKKPLLIGAGITGFTNDANKGFFRLEYMSSAGRSGFLEFSYDPLAQQKYEQDLKQSG